MSKTLLFISDIATANGPQPKKGKPTAYAMPIPTLLVSEDFASKEETCLWAQVKQLVTDPEDQKALGALIKAKFGHKEGSFGTPQWAPAFAFYKKLCGAKNPTIQNDQQMRQFAGVSWTLFLIEAAANNLVDWKKLNGDELFQAIEAAITDILYPEDAADNTKEDQPTSKEGELTIHRVDGNVLTTAMANLDESNEGLEQIAAGLVKVIQANQKTVKEVRKMIEAVPATSNALPDGKVAEDVESFDI